MHRIFQSAFIATALAVWLAPAARADPSEPSCQTAGEVAELEWGVPAGLLSAIGRMESGRYDAAAGRVLAWPWTINAAGQGYYFASKAEAVAGVQALLLRGIQSIDVGCFQINLAYHPDAFTSLEQAFDAGANAAYAARFLSELRNRSGSWEAAVAWYHSATPGLGEPYLDRVLADWSGGGLRIQPAVASALVRGIGAADPYVIRLTARATGVRVWTPAWAEAAPAGPAVLRVATGPAVLRVAASPLRPRTGGRMPRVITPRG